MWEKVIVAFLLIGAVHCDKGIKKPYHHHHHNDLMYGAGLLYYLTFLAIKIKIAFIIGGIIVLVLFFGKLWALVTYSKYMMGETKSKEPEKIYFQAPSHDFHHDIHDHGPPSGLSGPAGYGGPAFLDHPPESSYQDKRSPMNSAYLDHPPPSSMGGPSYGGDGVGYPNNMYLPPSGGYPNIAPHSYQQRGFNNSILNDLNMIAKFMEKLDLTEMAFNSMNIKDEECRRKYVCEVDVRTKTNPLLKWGYSMFGNKGLEKYRSQKTPSSFEECANVHSKCEATYVDK